MCRFFPKDRLPSFQKVTFTRRGTQNEKGRVCKTLFGGSIPSRASTFFQSRNVKKNTQPGPTTPFYKSRGKWTFYIFPHGVGEEAGDYPDEETARAASWKTHCVWQSNGCKY
jgi:hypothetical protein